MKIINRSNKSEPAPAERQTPDFFRELQIEFLIHELKGPAAVIETGVRALLERQGKFGALSPRQEKTLRRVLRNTGKMRQMMHSLLEIGRSQAGCFACACFDPARVTLETLVESVEITQGTLADQIPPRPQMEQLTDFLDTRGIRLEIDPEVMTAQMFQDETKFRQIVGNLIINALYHRRQTVAIHVQRQDDNLIVEVTDDGPGIAPEHHEIVFKRYAQIKIAGAFKRHGHGLGLAGSMILARSMGGNIQLNSKKGRGATFRLILPSTLATEAPQEPSQEER